MRPVELGVDHIDTAQYYGPGVANELIRTALHPYPAGLALVSKVGAGRDASGGILRYDRPAEIRQGIQDNLPPFSARAMTRVHGRIIGSFRPGRFEPVVISQVGEAGVVRRIGGPISAAAIPDMASANAGRSRAAR